VLNDTEENKEKKTRGRKTWKSGKEGGSYGTPAPAALRRAFGKATFPYN
jgi:hypothetical protein